MTEVVRCSMGLDCSQIHLIGQAMRQAAETVLVTLVARC